jgi:hypothetical protein
MEPDAELEILNNKIQTLKSRIDSLISIIRIGNASREDVEELTRLIDEKNMWVINRSQYYRKGK